MNIGIFVNMLLANIYNAQFCNALVWQRALATVKKLQFAYLGTSHRIDVIIHRNNNPALACKAVVLTRCPAIPVTCGLMNNCENSRKLLKMALFAAWAHIARRINAQKKSENC